MSRAIVQLRPDQRSSRREVASRRGVSVSHLVREGVDRVLSESNREDSLRRIMTVAGCGEGSPDLAEDTIITWMRHTKQR